jgi:FG-GAP-like repeat
MTNHIVGFKVIASVGFAAILAALCPLSAHAQNATAGQGVMGAGQHAPFVTQQQPPVLTPEQQRARDQAMKNSNLPGPPLPVEPGARVTPPSVPSTGGHGGPPPGAAAASPAAGSAGTYTVFRQTAQSPYSTGTSVIDEPHAGTEGKIVFTTGNWFASYSNNYGASFSFVNPYTFGSSLDAGFCCDQTVIYDHTRDLMIWQLQYIYSSSTQKGSYRTAFARSASVPSTGWCYYDWSPQSFGLAAGLWLDYPHVALSNNYVWYTANVYNASSQWQTTVIWRIPLDPTLTCSGFNYQWFTQAHFNFTPTQAATTTMYWGSHNSTSSLRVYHWDESSGTIFWNDVSIGTWSNSTPYKCAGPDGQNWCGRGPNDGRIETGWVANGVIGFMWNAGQGGSFAYPYIDVARFNQSTFALINQPIIWNGSYAWQYPAIGVNDRGDIAGSAYWGGGSYYPTMVTLIDDLFSSTPPPWENYGVVTSAQGATSWGDWYASRRHGTYGNTWITTGETHLANGNVQSYYVWFGRQQDTPPAGKGTHDFNGDGFSDIAWRDTSANAAVWLMNGSQILQSGGFGQIPNWSIVGQRDFNGDGKYDWLWRDTSGDVAIWFMNGVQVSWSAFLGQVPTSWQIVGTGDFNGDGNGDILWRDNVGDVAIWFMNGSQVSSSVGLGQVPTSWTISQVGDFNGDGKGDILWRDNVGDVAIWFMNGSQISSSAFLGQVPTAWSIIGVGDFDGNGKADILWRDNVGDVAIWFMNGSQVSSSVGLGQITTFWSIVQTGDYNADGKSDIFWKDGNGNIAVWFMNGSTIASSAGLGNVGTSWSVQSQNAE